RALMDRGLVSLKPARTRMLERLIKDAPRFHSANGALTSWSVQAETLRYLDSVLEPGMKTLETGCGQTTVVFAIARTRHVCVTPNREEVDRVQRYCAQLGLEPSLVFVIDSSDKALPREDVVLRDLDLIFIDGAHAFPAPILDWHYSARGLKIGGLLAVDDYKMPSVKMLFDFLRGEEEWELLSIVQNTAFFRKRAEMKALADWRGQKINSQYPGY
ncbi:MAG TPA: class I SAM-dependent methyltransferase, partial [Candidatus Eisenbacteria bacterium]|nr:class I SAM-dependent methyltransferase [Candidatus Eisenbacteria bacterium]